MRDPRYRRAQSISRSRGRVVDIAHDQWCDVSVIVKQAPVHEALRESSCLLRLPPGIAPRVRDLVWHGGGKLTLVLDHLDGRTLAEHVKIGVPVELPRLAYEISQTLAHVHRLGWVHSDLKPGNIFLLANDVEGPVRLLDFGYAFDRFADPSDAERGGSARYIAPEIRRGWIADGRADLYSLGMVLRTCFPALKSDLVWRGLLDNLTSPVPADRYPDAIALRDAIAQAFNLGPSMTRVPHFPAGPIRGRSTELRSLVETATSADPSMIFVQARPGVGLTRFLLEAVLELAEADAPAARIVDFGNLPDSVLEEAAAFLERSAVVPAIVLCGMPDPSPSLSWLPERLGEHLNRLRTRLHPLSILLPPLTEESFRELVVTSLGSLDSGSEAVVAPLFDQTEGDLLDAAIGFDECIRSTGIEDGPTWRLLGTAVGTNVMRAVLSTTLHPIPEIPASMLDSLRRCARAGLAFPADVAEDLLTRFGDSEILEGLIDHGYLLRETPDRLRFVSRRLWLALASDADPLAPSIDRWLNEWPDPNITDITAVQHACRVAQRVGDLHREAQLLGAALVEAYDRRRWADVLTLLGYQSGVTGAGVASAGELDEVVARLGGKPSLDRLRLMIGASLTTIDPGIGVQMLEQAADGKDRDAAGEALIILIDLIADKSTAPKYEEHMRALATLVDSGVRIPAGILEFFEARRHMATGDPVAALEHAEWAAQMLRGVGGYYEPLSFQLVAILRFPSTPMDAVGFLRAAVESARDIAVEAQLRHNLALMYANVGPFHLAEECTDSILRRAGHRLSLTRRIGLRIQRAWAWADLDRIEPAIQEACALLSFSRVRLAPARLIPLRLLLAYCDLHRGSAAAAVSEAYRAWRDVADTGPRDLQARSLRFLTDAIIDLEDWDFAKDHAADFRTRILGPDPVFRTTEARASALLAQAEGHPLDALDLLREHVDEARRFVNRLSAARYLHHLGVAALQGCTGNTDKHLCRSAAESFTEELSVLISPGHGYYRGRALLQLSKAAKISGDSDRSSEALADALELARAIGSTGLLTDCLEAQARMLIDPE